ncbi:MAG: hypothetical protein ACI857_003354, partial [Arenicella sp.]
GTKPNPGGNTTGAKKPQITNIAPTGSSIGVTTASYMFKARVTNVSSKSGIKLFVNGSPFTAFTFSSSNGQVTAVVKLRTGANTIKLIGKSGTLQTEKTYTISYKPAVSRPTNNGTSKPTNTGTNKPVNTGTSKPTNTGTTKPTNTGTSKPTNTGTTKPTNTGTTKPTNTGTSKPTNTGTTKPTNTGTSKPTNTGTKKVENGGTTTNPEKGKTRGGGL